jgi:hypothetical protein
MNSFYLIICRKFIYFYNGNYADFLMENHIEILIDFELEFKKKITGFNHQILGHINFYGD